jgi:hypothetical protein
MFGAIDLPSGNGRAYGVGWGFTCVTTLARTPTKVVLSSTAVAGTVCPCPDLCEVHVAARILHGGAQCPCTCGGDQSNQDPERDDQQFHAVAGAHKWIAAAAARRSHHTWIESTPRMTTQSRNEPVTGSEPLSRVRGGYW